MIDILFLGCSPLIVAATPSVVGFVFFCTQHYHVAGFYRDNAFFVRLGAQVEDRAHSSIESSIFGPHGGYKLLLDLGIRRRD